MDKHGFDKNHNCVVAEVPVIITATKLMDIPVNYSQLLNDMIELDIYKMLLSFPWRPGDLLCWCVNFARVNMLVLKLMCLLLQSQVYSGMNTDAYNKFCMEVELLHSKISMSVSLINTINLNLCEEEVDKMQVDQTALADTLMVLLEFQGPTGPEILAPAGGFLPSLKRMFASLTFFIIIMIIEKCLSPPSCV